MTNGMTRLLILFFSIAIACIGLLTISTIPFLMGMKIRLNLSCPSCANISYKVVFPHSVPEVINTTQAFIDKFNRSPKTFPYERVEVEPQVKKALVERFPFQEIATFKITNDHYVTIFLTDKPNYYLEVSWMLFEGKINILDKKTQEGIFILKTTYSKSYSYNTTDAYTTDKKIRYEIKGEATYYEISIQINSVKYIEGTIYHTYDWTTTYAYLGSNLIYSVTASGDFYWNYGVEVWVYPSASHQTYFSGWARCWLNKEVVGQHTTACYVEAVGRASALLYYVPPSVSVNFKNTADVAHDCWGGEHHWGYVDFYHSYGLPCK